MLREIDIPEYGQCPLYNVHWTYLVLFTVVTYIAIYIQTYILNHKKTD